MTKKTCNQKRTTKNVVVAMSSSKMWISILYINIVFHQSEGGVETHVNSGSGRKRSFSIKDFFVQHFWNSFETAHNTVDFFEFIFISFCWMKNSNSFKIVQITFRRSIFTQCTAELIAIWRYWEKIPLSKCENTFLK